MFKELKKFQIRLTPFQAAKDWALNNKVNEDELLFESTGSDDGEPIDLEYLDYNPSSSFDNYQCEIALEQQDSDKANYQEGLKLTGPFYPDSDPTNADGTFKRVIHSQVKTSFYNQYRDPTKLLGLENIDFENGKTKRRLADRLRMFDIPRDVFGDKMTPNTIALYDTTLDNDYTISDDGFGNLFAGDNLFSKQQEIGFFTNSFDSGSFDAICNTYFLMNVTPVLSASYSSGSNILTGTGSLFWDISYGTNTILTLYRSTTTTYPSYSIIAHPNGLATYKDIPLQFGNIYIYQLGISGSLSSSFSNEVSVSLAGAIETWEGYPLGRTGSFNGGSGSWVGGWWVDTRIGIQAQETWEEYPLTTTNHFSGGFGWNTEWNVTMSYVSMVASENWEEYPLGTSTSQNLSGSTGWSGSWYLV